jgi:hypothetical protein
VHFRACTEPARLTPPPGVRTPGHGGLAQKNECEINKAELRSADSRGRLSPYGHFPSHILSPLNRSQQKEEWPGLEPATGHDPRPRCYRPRLCSSFGALCFCPFGCFCCFCGFDDVELDLGELSACESLDEVDFGWLADLPVSWFVGLVDACSLLLLAFFEGGVDGRLAAFEPLEEEEEEE